MNKHDQLKSVIQSTGLTFQDNGNVFSSFWKVTLDKRLKVLIAYDIHPDWVHILCPVGDIEKFSNFTSNVLLRLNNSYVGTKFALEKNRNIVCSSEIPFKFINEDILKQEITQVVKMVSHFYECAEKENLKLNSA